MIKFGLLGCGRIAKRHSDLLGGGHIPGAELVAVCDEVRERADAIAARFGVPAFYNIDEFLGRKDIQAVWVIEDCAQAHLARYKGQQVGTFGEAATYSFYPDKNLGAMGDAGAIDTGRSDLAERMAMLARHGGLVKHQHQIEGINSRLDGLQAAILSAKLPHLARWTQARQAAAAVCNADLNQIEEVVVPQVAPDRTHVYHLYTIQHPQRDELAAHLNANVCKPPSTIRLRCHFWKPTGVWVIVPSSFRMPTGIGAEFCRCRCLRESRRNSRRPWSISFALSVSHARRRRYRCRAGC